MTPASKIKKNLTWTHWGLMILAGLIFFIIFAFAYVSFAFPKVRCEGIKHLESTEKTSDCFECHIKATPKRAQDWLESKHGVMLVKCFVCHGQPDGKGSVPWTNNPDVDATCRKCHDPSIIKMREKYGVDRNCQECHPFHNNSLHHEAYEKTKAKKSVD